MASRYQPTRLPNRLDLSRLNTAQQLTGINEPPEIINPQHRSKEKELQDEVARQCQEIIEGNIDEYLNDRRLIELGDMGLHFQTWLRHFHTEYDEVWFIKNNDRLVRSFRPLWDRHLANRNKLETNAAAPCSPNSPNLDDDFRDIFSNLSNGQNSVNVLPDLLG